MKHTRWIALALSFAVVSIPASANDSSAAIGVGGLELKQNDAIRMDSEDLYLSRAKVTVKYRFTNTSDRDVENMVSFPLPPIPTGLDGYLDVASISDWREQLQFKTLVDGKPVELAYYEAVILSDRAGPKDLSSKIKALGWPIRYWDDYDFDQKFVEPLSNAEKTKLVAEGLLRKDPETDYYSPNWQMQAHVTRTQRFPAGKTITVEHSYKPVTGGSVGGALDASYRKEDYFREYAAKFCIDKPFLAAFDKRRRTQKKDEVYYLEHWLDYVLKSGANWKGPIKDFRLVVEKDKPENFVSFCMDGVKKISPTRFEVRKANFEPANDLSILIVEFYNPNAG